MVKVLYIMLLSSILHVILTSKRRPRFYYFPFFQPWYLVSWLYEWAVSCCISMCGMYTYCSFHGRNHGFNVLGITCYHKVKSGVLIPWWWSLGTIFRNFFGVIPVDCHFCQIFFKCHTLGLCRPPSYSVATSRHLHHRSMCYPISW